MVVGSSALLGLSFIPQCSGRNLADIDKTFALAFGKTDHEAFKLRLLPCILQHRANALKIGFLLFAEKPDDQPAVPNGEISAAHLLEHRMQLREGRVAETPSAVCE